MDRDKKTNTTDQTKRAQNPEQGSSIKDLPAKKLSREQEEKVKGGRMGDGDQLSQDEL
ncbi:MAG: hypothetical protein WKG32_14545 [Gemmatimonadaceae bacterium]